MKNLISLKNSKNYFMILIIMAVLISVFRIHYYDWPPNRDVTEYAVTSHELLSGKKLYSDIWNPKPPAIFISYGIAEKLLGYGPGAIYVMNLVFTLITLLGVYTAGVASGFGPQAGIFSALFWTLLSGDISLQLHDANTETFMNAFLIWAFVLFLSPPDKPFSNSRAVVIGLLFAWASLYKHVIVAIACTLSIAHIVIPPIGTNRRKATTHILIIAAIGVASWGCLFAYMAFTDRFQIFYDTIITHGLDYAWSRSATLAGTLPSSPNSAASSNYNFLGEAIHRFKVLIPLIIIASTGIVYALIKERSRIWVLIVMYALGAFISIVLPGKFYRHYFQIGIPSLVVAGAWAIVVLTREVTKKKVFIPHVVAGIIGLFIAINELPYYLSQPDQLLKGTYAEQYLVTQDVGRKLAVKLNPDNKIFHWGTESGLYFFSQKRPPGQILGWSLWSRTFGELFTAKTLDELEKAPPDVVILSRYIIGSHPDHPLLQWICNNYCTESGLTEEEEKFFILKSRCEITSAPPNDSHR